MRRHAITKTRRIFKEKPSGFTMTTTDTPSIVNHNTRGK